MTEVRRINLSENEDVDKAIAQECDIMEATGFKLVSSFVFKIHLILIFQKI